MVGTATSDLVRLHALRQGKARLQVDRAFPGRIRGVSILTTGPALGHGFEVDRTTIEQVSQLAPGMRGRWTHGGLSEDGLGRHLGAWEDVRIESFHLCRACGVENEAATCSTCGAEAGVEWRSVGDFAFASSAHKIRPDGLDVPAPVYLMERALEDPESLGISIVARFGFYEPPVREGERQRRLARLEAKQDLKRGDWVADPAANPVGLHAGTGAPSALTEAAARELDRIVAREGTAKAKLRALAFLARYFGDEDSDDDGDEAPQGADARVAELERQLEAQARELEALRAALRRHEAAEAERQRGEDADYVEALRQESAALNAPIAAADLARVATLLREGQRETAQLLGEAYLARSRAENQAEFTRSGTHPLGKDHDRAKASVLARARMLRRRGWTVELNDDGTEIVRSSPPGEGR
ncbi:MAG: hypothetical protein M9894_09540 [Planctomycetes bacterium]|nr:hypothetical protein [Planctomycetota bacterium]